MSRLANRRPVPIHERNQRAKTRAYALHEVNPAGTKMVLRFYKAKHGTHAASLDEAWKWYRGYLSAMDKKARQREEQHKLDRIKRRFPWLAHRLPAVAA